MRRSDCLVLFLSLTALGGATASAIQLKDVPPIDDTALFQKIRQLIPAKQELPCNLECKNGGACSYIPGTIEQWRYFAQTGVLVQRCTCPDGFAGVGCEIPVERCVTNYVEPDPLDSSAQNTYTCALSGKPCDILPDGSRTCACHVADAVDPNFAGRVCRKWDTEYCNGSLQANDGSVYLCTNGGKCQSDFIAAQIAPGGAIGDNKQPNDSTVNEQYADAGCVCNQHFYGPHCEFLDFNDRQNIAMQAENGRINDFHGGAVAGSPNPGRFIGMFVGLVGITVVAVVLYRRRKREAWRTAMVRPREGVFRDENSNGVEFADNHTGDGKTVDLYSHEFDDTVAMQEINLEEEGGTDPLQAPVASAPTLAKATSLQEDDNIENDEVGEEDLEGHSPYFT